MDIRATEVSDLIKESYCYKEHIISDLYIPFNLKNTKNKLLKYKKISLIFMINFNCIILYLLYILNIYVNKL